MLIRHVKGYVTIKCFTINEQLTTLITWPSTQSNVHFFNLIIVILTYI